MPECNKKQEWYLYMIECKDTKLYTGITNDLGRRIEQHNRGKGCRFTSFRTPVKLIYKKIYSSKNEALKREAEIKGWSREKKLALLA